MNDLYIAPQHMTRWRLVVERLKAFGYDELHMTPEELARLGSVRLLLEFERLADFFEGLESEDEEFSCPFCGDDEDDEDDD